MKNVGMPVNGEHFFIENSLVFYVLIYARSTGSTALRIVTIISSVSTGFYVFVGAELQVWNFINQQIDA